MELKENFRRPSYWGYVSLTPPVLYKCKFDVYRDPTLDPAVSAPRSWQLLIWQILD
jgi:hypothetical protein